MRSAQRTCRSADARSWLARETAMALPRPPTALKLRPRPRCACTCEQGPDVTSRHFEDRQRTPSRLRLGQSALQQAVGIVAL
jgi:hypothetical protein